MRITRLHRFLKYEGCIDIILRTFGTVLEHCVPMLLNNSRSSSYAANQSRSYRNMKRGANKGNAAPSRSYTSEIIKCGGNYLARQSLIFIVVSTMSVSCDAPSMLMKRRDIQTAIFQDVYTFFVKQYFCITV